MKSLGRLLGVSAVTAVLLVSTADAGKTPNCEVDGKAIHVTSRKACHEKKGTWLPSARHSSTVSSATPPKMNPESAN